MYEYVASRLVLPGVVVTWFVTGLPDPGKGGGSHPLLLEPALSGKTRGAPLCTWIGQPFHEPRQRPAVAILWHQQIYVTSLWFAAARGCGGRFSRAGLPRHEKISAWTKRRSG